MTPVAPSTDARQETGGPSRRQHLRADIQSKRTDIEAQIAALEALTIADLRVEWCRLYRATLPTRLSRDLLIRGVVYSLQERAFGMLSLSTRRMLHSLSQGGDQRGGPAAIPITLKPGTKLVREWHGHVHTVAVLNDGFEYQGQRYPSLTRIARRITGSHWSGPLFSGSVSGGDWTRTRQRTRKSMSRQHPLRCAVYTRKSSEEGLEQAFNSLHAQREACEAFIKSQRHEDWSCLPQLYDDGGRSGGTMERPALQQLLADIQSGKVDVVAVYKIDRLTRSLADFAKIVEIFDAKGVSFVSVTQQFNTTTSMGRLTLNVLLSFAQFEREVTRRAHPRQDPASKKKGMWMGGVPPLGYAVRERKLIIIEREAETVRHIFRRYAALGSARLLKQELEAEGIAGKRWTSVSGRRWGGRPIGRGALYLMLRNRLYRGEIIHQDQTYPGEHAAIIDLALWDAVQGRLAENAVECHTGIRVKNPSLLVGLLFDNNGQRLTPTHAVKNGRRYRYYVSRSLITGARADTAAGMRLPGSGDRADRHQPHPPIAFRAGEPFRDFRS